MAISAPNVLSTAISEHVTSEKNIHSFEGVSRIYVDTFPDLGSENRLANYASSSIRDDHTMIQTGRAVSKAKGPHWRTSCTCPCHTPFLGNTPRYLKELIGLFSFRFSGSSLSTCKACDLPDCRFHQGTVNTVQVQFHPPSWLSYSRIDLTGRWGSLGGIGATLFLKVARVVTDEVVQDKIRGVLLYGSPRDLRDLLISLKITPIDMLLVEEGCFVIMQVSLVYLNQCLLHR
jgi:hypothetical protein